MIRCHRLDLFQTCETILPIFQKTVHETAEPVFLTKNGYGDMVVMSIEAYEHKLLESEIYFKLKEAELEAKSTDKRLSHEEVFSDLRSMLAGKVEQDNV